MRARLSRPLHGAGKGRQPSRSDHRSSRHGSRRSGRSSLARLPPRSSRGVGPRAPPPSSAKKASGSRGRRPRPPLPPPARARPSRPLPPPARSRPLPPPARSRPLPPPARSYDRRPPGTTRTCCFLHVQLSFFFFLSLSVFEILILQFLRIQRLA